jgi:hypothetical protein
MEVSTKRNKNKSCVYIMMVREECNGECNDEECGGGRRCGNIRKGVLK